MIYWLAPGSAVEPQFNKPLFSEVLGITNDILRPSVWGQLVVKYFWKNPDIRKPLYSEHIFPVLLALPLVILRFHCSNDQIYWRNMVVILVHTIYFFQNKSKNTVSLVLRVSTCEKFNNTIHEIKNALEHS